jgi:hypothetical protein
MAGRRNVPDGSSLITDLNTDEVVRDGSKLSSDQEWTTYYSPYGKAVRFPVHAQLDKIRRKAGWLTSKPRVPKKTPTVIKMRDGSEFDFSSATADVTQAELDRINGGGKPGNSVPTATYYSAMGDVLPNLPADPVSMKQYMELGLSLTPPTKAAGEVTKLHAV